MNRRKFLAVTGGLIVSAAGITYLISDKNNVIRTSHNPASTSLTLLKPDEKEILILASLAPSGHNTQPWFVKYNEPYYWTICNDRSKWLSAVDSTQRETVLSIGAFLQNLEYAAGNAGYNCSFNILAKTNQEENIVDVKLNRSNNAAAFSISKIITRRTVRSNYLSDLLKKEDMDYLFSQEKDFFNFMPNGTKEYHYLSEQTIQANEIQSYRDAAEQELSEWIRFSNKDAKKYNDGLTTASMEINGMPGWVVRNFYNKSSVMKIDFREKNIDNVKKQVSKSAGWLIITSKDNEVATLLETGKRMQRLFLKVREKSIAIHPMTQILEEYSTKQVVNQSIGINNNIQFILRMGYINNYPDPVTLRRPVDWFLKSKNG